MASLRKRFPSPPLPPPSESFTNPSNTQALCHCLQCRKITGTTYSTCLLVPSNSFTITSGAPKHYTFTQESGLKFTTNFCGDCGGVIGKSQTGGDEFKDLVIVFAGTLDGKEGIENIGKPEAEIWVTHRAPWVKPVEGVEAQAEMFPSN
jgi:hypothetical protein